MKSFICFTAPGASQITGRRQEQPTPFMLGLTKAGRAVAQSQPLPPVLSGRGCLVRKVWSLAVSPFSETVFS